MNLDGYAKPRRMPAWMGAIVCLFTGHRFSYNSANTWRCCGRCRHVDERQPDQCWPEDQ